MPAATEAVSPATVYESESTRVFRLPEHAGIVCKQPLGRGAGERLRHERDVLTRLAHVEGIARIDATVEIAGALALKDGGQTLAARLAAGRMEMPPLLTLACGLAETLSKVHGAGVVHRDINPSNILCSADGHCTLVDFDSAVVASGTGPGGEGADGSAGTLAYIAPEQTGRTGRAIDHRADLYSLGVVLYEMVLGRVPFESADALQLMHAHLVELPAVPCDVDPNLVRPLSDIILRLLEKEPSRRYQGAEGLAHDLQRVRQAVAGNEECRFTIGEHDFGARLAPPDRTVGREAELAALRALLGAPLHEREPCILLAGPGGAGKTRLVNELKALATANQDWFVSATFRPHRSDATAAAASLRSLARLLLAEPEEQLDVYRKRMRKAVGGNLGLGVTQFPEFELLLGKHEPPQITDPREAEARVNQASLDLLRSAASCGRRVVMVLEDLQWAPSITLAFLDAVVSSPTPFPGLLVVGTYRTSDVDAGHPLLGLFERWRTMRTMPAQLEVTHLPATALAQMVAHMLRETPAHVNALAAALHDRTGGNPHDTIELVNALRQEGLLRREEGSWRWDAAQVRAYVGECSVPLLLARRVARLSAEGRFLLECLACLGGAVRGAVLEAATGVREATLRERLIPAAEDGLLVVQDGDSGVVRFRHPRVQQTVLDAMEPGRRVQQHLELARRLVRQPGLEPLAAEQYLPAAGLIEQEEERLHVARLFQEAARETGTFHLSVGERYLASAMTLMAGAGRASSAQYLELAAARHRLLYAMGRLEEGDALYALVAAGEQDPGRLAPVARVQMYSLANRARYQEALALGLGLLAALGLQRPADHRAAVRAGFARVAEWYRSDARLADFDRPLVSDPALLATASL
ncbi:MAG TPA: AAA family ATPase, partial [Ramlibacter sp.]|nr:AAA family ATPase [Ramlibacter sp.]